MGIVVTFQAAPLVFLGNIENTNLLKLSLFCWNLFRTLVINTNPFMVDYGQSWQATPALPPGLTHLSQMPRLAGPPLVKKGRGSPTSPCE